MSLIITVSIVLLETIYHIWNNNQVYFQSAPLGDGYTPIPNNSKPLEKFGCRRIMDENILDLILKSESEEAGEITGVVLGEADQGLALMIDEDDELEHGDVQANPTLELDSLIDEYADRFMPLDIDYETSV